MAQTKTASTVAPKRSPRTLAGAVVPARDDARTHAIQGYETAVALMQTGKFAKAQEAFVKTLESAPPDIADRIRVHVSACLMQINKGTTTFRSHEERYDFAISLLNGGNYDDARKQFGKIEQEHPEAKYVYYGMAVLASMTRDTGACLKHLAEAIKHDPKHRLQARSDPDFQDMADDPRFTELLYPEA